ncbi:MAG: fructose-bisphosphatase class III [Acidobacteria bacterium]|nr:fructose-bisphosphatase class III [Acidobacteriota bacterium]
MSSTFDTQELTMLHAVASQYPTTDEALAEISILKAGLSLPKGVVHIVSDVHGEYKKLRHIINNASGSLRLLVETRFGNRLSTQEQQQLLATIYYPHEVIEHLRPQFQESGFRHRWVRNTIRHQFEVVLALGRNYRRRHVTSLFPREFQELFEELLDESAAGRGSGYINAMLEALEPYDRDLTAVRAASRLVRNLSVSELVVAGDLGDRGPRLDKVLDYLMQQPNVSFTWGNHDASWMGACLGNEALIATVLRISLRYRRLSQLEEGYGLIVSPLEKLARTVYGNDPAKYFSAKGTGLREEILLARMQKAIAIIQFKLEGQIIRRHPEWEMEHRALLHRINFQEGTITIDDKVFPLRDTYLPTIDPVDPYRLSHEEQVCMDRMRQSFVSSDRLWQHMSFVARRGAMWLRRDQAVIFHGCVPVDEAGDFLSVEVDGKNVSGRGLFDALEFKIRGAFRKGAERVGIDADWLWYLWTGPRSPLFGKDRMATFETYFIDDKSIHVEHKNPYFKLIHDADFCRVVCGEFGVFEDGLIVNGHVPVKVEKGEQPVKRGGNAVTIDGAFSEAYGDRGYTLILAPERIALAEHHHFESINEAITSGADIIPKVENLRTYDPQRTIGDTEEGEEVRHKIGVLERLVLAYEEGVIHERNQITH